MSKEMSWTRVGSALSAGLLLLAMILAGQTDHASAAAQLIQSATPGTTDGGTGVSITFPNTAAANNLIVVICGARTAVTITGPSGFTTAKNESGTPSQAIFYKVSNGTEKTLNCTVNSSTRIGMQAYEYTGTVTSGPLDAVNTVSSVGTSSSPASGSVTTANENDIIIAGVTTNANTTISSWTNSFIAEEDFTNGGSNSLRSHYGGADRIVTTTGTYSTVASAGASAAWRGQIAAFKVATPALNSDVVDAGGNPVTMPVAAMSAATYSFACQTSTGVLGESNQRIRLTNTTYDPAWTLSVAATGGSSSVWSIDSSSYAFNDPNNAGCSAGQLTIDPSVGTLTPKTGCSNTGVSLGSRSAFSSGAVDSITIASANTSAGINCYWDITGMSLSQTIPAEQRIGSYALSLTLTAVAN